MDRHFKEIISLHVLLEGSYRYCVCFFFFLVISAIVWWLSKSIEHVFELHKVRTSQIFHHQSTYWFVSMMRFFSSFFPFVIILMKCRFVYIFHSHGIAVVSRLVPLPSVWMFTIVQLHHRYFFAVYDFIDSKSTK